MNWYTYEIAPIDIGWEHLRTLRETVGFLAAEMQSKTRGNDIDLSDLHSFLAAWKSAKEEASVKGWEGDLRIEPAVFWVPADVEFCYGFVLKQDNNGTTYVVSPVPMPWLEE